MGEGDALEPGKLVYRRSARYTDAAIQTSLMLRTAFKLPLRPTEGLMASAEG